MKKLAAKPVLIALLAVLAVASLALCIALGSSILTFLRGESGSLPADWWLRLDKAIVLDEEGQTTVQGEVVQPPGRCHGDQESCYFYLTYKDVVVAVHYLMGTGAAPCTHTGPADVARTLGTGDEVEVFGKYIGDGAIAMCDSPDY